MSLADSRHEGQCSAKSRLYMYLLYTLFTRMRANMTLADSRHGVSIVPKADWRLSHGFAPRAELF